jgi:hypothetical protein
LANRVLKRSFPSPYIEKIVVFSAENKGITNFYASFKPAKIIVADRSKVDRSHHQNILVIRGIYLFVKLQA